jgi:putative transcriptional regulator
MKNCVRELRAQRNWTQQNVADRIDVSRQTINAIETGRYDPGLPMAFALAKLFKKSIEEIFQVDN